VGILVCEGVGALAGVATRSSVDTWYPTLAKPGFTPPDWLFAPVWITLYAMMGVAAGLVWTKRADASAAQSALVAFGVQLVLNAAWSVVFFGAQSIGGGLLVIVPLAAAIAETMRRMWPLSRLAAGLLVPYLGWVLYATALNLGLWVLNG
jgi:tryptophan-rich sensory protein